MACIPEQQISTVEENLTQGSLTGAQNQKPICSVFMEVAEGTVVLKTACFDDVNVSNQHGLFQRTNGLLYRPAQVSNAGAQYVLAKSYVDYFSKPDSRGWNLLYMMYRICELANRVDEVSWKEVISGKTILQVEMKRELNRSRQGNGVSTMQAIRRMITDLHFDLLKCIMILMVKSSDGAANLARAKAVCSVFSKVAEDPDVLKAVCFQDVIINPSGLFQQTNGLLHRCAQVGNAAAQYLLAKVILMSASQLLAAVREGSGIYPRKGEGSGSLRKKVSECLRKMPRDDSAANFLAHFAPDQACSTKYSSQTLLHPELVRNFLCQCSAHDVTLMHLHLHDYVNCFVELGSHRYFVLRYLINKMCHYGNGVRASQNETLEDKKEMKELFMEQIEHLVAWKFARQSDQDDVAGGSHNEFVQLSREDWYLRLSSLFPDKTYASIEDVELDGLYAFSGFEECRISTIACFDHVFP